MRITDECLACGACAEECAFGAIKEGEIYVITDECTDCGACAEVCPAGAIVAE